LLVLIKFKWHGRVKKIQHWPGMTLRYTLYTIQLYVHIVGYCVCTQVHCTFSTNTILYDTAA
jgi:hypothetical protein